MKKLFNIILLALAVVAFASCGKEPVPSFVPKTINAFVDDDLTKTTLSGLNVLWENGDVITVFDDDLANHPSNALTISEPVQKVTYVVPTLSADSGVLAAVYPKDDNASCDADYVYTTLPSVQTAKAGSFGANSNLSVAGTENSLGALAFKNVGGLLSLSITSDVTDIESITISANEAMSGPVIVDLDDFSAIIDEEKSAGTKSVTINGQITSGKYYFSVLPGTYSGLSITFTRSNGATATYTNDASLTVSRNANIFIGSITLNGDNSKWQGGSNEAAMDCGTNGSTATVNGKTAIKVGTSKAGGDMTITVGAGATQLEFYAAAWKGTSNLSLGIVPVAKVENSSILLKADDGITSSSPFTLSGSEDDFKFSLALNNITEETTFTFTSDKRFVIWDAKYLCGETKAPDHITVTGAKSLYKVGEVFSTDNLVVTAYYDAEESESKVINSGYSISKTTALAVDDNSIVVSYTEAGVTKTAEVSIDVVPLDHIEIATAPSTVTYFVGSNFDPTGMVVSAIWGSESEKTITEEVTFSVTDGLNLELGKTFVTISYSHEGITKTTTQAITVNPIPDKTIEEFIAAQGGTCYLTGFVSNITNEIYGNFDLTDASGTIMVYGCLTPSKESKQFGSLGVVAGDKIKVLADEHVLYGETHEAKNVVFVEEIAIVKSKYAVTIVEPSNGTLEIKNGDTTVANGDLVEEGTILTVVVTADDGYAFKSWGYKDGESSWVSNNTTSFTHAMPNSPVQFKAVFEKTYTISCLSNDNGTVTADKTTAFAGETVTLTSNPNSNYKFSSYSVSTANGDSVTVTDGKFDMPASNVSVSVVFEENTSSEPITVTYTLGSDITSSNYSEGVTKNGVKVKFEQGTGSTLAYYSPYRLYQGNRIVITGAMIQKVTFEITSGSITSLTPNAGTVSGSSWDGNAKYLVLSNSGTSQIRFSSMSVTYVPISSGGVSSDYTTEKEVTYTINSTTSVSVTSGTAPLGSSADYSSTYGTKSQLTSGKKMTLTLYGYDPKKITGLVLSMKSNASAGAGYLSFTAGTTTLATIGSNNSGVAFNNENWAGKYSGTYIPVTVNLSNSDYIVKENETVELVIGATTNSLFCETITIKYKE